MGSAGQGSSLQGSVKTASPLQSFPSLIGGIHFLCKVLVPPPQARVQEDQSYKGTQYPSSPSLGAAPSRSVLISSPSGPVYLYSIASSMVLPPSAPARSAVPSRDFS